MVMLNTLKPDDRFTCIDKQGTVVLVQPGRVLVKWDAGVTENLEGLPVNIPTKFMDIAPGTEVEII